MNQNQPKDNRFSELASDERIQKTKIALENKGFKVIVVDDIKEAATNVLDIIPKKSRVFTATSTTLDQAGLTDKLNSEDYTSVRDSFIGLYGQEDKQIEMRQLGSASDYTAGSVHALTEDGKAVIASATGSQLPNYAYGASHVIWIVGTQKIVKDLDEAFERIENYTFFLENERAKKAYGSGSSINRLLIYPKDPTNRVTIVLVKQNIGF